MDAGGDRVKEAQKRKTYFKRSPIWIKNETIWPRLNDHTSIELALTSFALIGGCKYLILLFQIDFFKSIFFKNGAMLSAAVITVLASSASGLKCASSTATTITASWPAVDATDM